MYKLMETSHDVMYQCPTHLYVNFIELQARDLPKIVQAAYHLVRYFVFSPHEGEFPNKTFYQT